jgi:hypothetical protein
MSIRVKNWSQFQHFKDRKPIWIKLYRELLDDIQWHELDAKSSKVLVMLWLLASEDDGNLPDIKTISFRLRMPESEVNACISRLSHYLEQDASTVISSVYQPDILEKRREETEKKPVSLEIPDWIDVNDWKDFVEMRKKIGKPMTDRASKLIISKLEKMKVKGISPSVSLQNSILNAWQDVYEPKVQTQQNSMGRRVL